MHGQLVGDDLLRAAGHGHQPVGPLGVLVLGTAPAHHRATNDVQHHVQGIPDAWRWPTHCRAIPGPYVAWTGRQQLWALITWMTADGTSRAGRLIGRQHALQRAPLAPRGARIQERRRHRAWSAINEAFTIALRAHLSVFLGGERARMRRARPRRVGGWHWLLGAIAAGTCQAKRFADRADRRGGDAFAGERHQTCSSDGGVAPSSTSRATFLWISRMGSALRSWACRRACSRWRRACAAA